MRSKWEKSQNFRGKRNDIPCLQRCVFGVNNMTVMTSICHFKFCKDCGILLTRWGWCSFGRLFMIPQNRKYQLPLSQWLHRMPRQRQRSHNGKQTGPANISKKQVWIYGPKTQGGELVALGAYEISEDVVTVHIVYMERQAQSNPTLCESPKYHGIGRVLIAYGIFLLFPIV